MYVYSVYVHLPYTYNPNLFYEYSYIEKLWFFFD